MITYGTAPADDEIEITVMGPGYGECIVVHLGCKHWVVVDSCIARGEKTAHSLQYLAAIGVNYAAVRYLFVSHWHDDHIRGLSESYQNFPNAKLVLPLAMQTREFSQYLQTFGDPGVTASPGAAEMQKTLNIVASRMDNKNAVHPIFWGTAGRSIYKNKIGGEEVTLSALSPSDADFSNAVARFARLIPHDNDPVARAVEPSPNEIAMALHITIGRDTILLGSDLETTSNIQCGWDGVINYPGRPTERAVIYKVAHHGSVTGEHDGIWADLLTNMPISLLTPFRRGNVQLPKESDRTRINSKSLVAYTSSVSKEPIAIESHVLKRMKMRARSVDVSSMKFGVVRLRKKINETEWKVETFGAAGKL